jgi:membrane associated rhomboid family serine protease
VTITLVLIIVTVLISMYAFNRPEILYRYMMNPYMITHRGQYYRLLTSGFLHGNHLHLIFNMFSFYFFGTAVEQILQYLMGFELGSITFVALYLSAIVVSDLPTLFRHRHNAHYNSLGASGGVSAIVFAFILFMPLEDLCLYGFICIPGFIMGTLYVIYSYFQSKRSADNINHDAHLFGALYGLVFCIILFPKAVPLFFEQLSQWGVF